MGSIGQQLAFTILRRKREILPDSDPISAKRVARTPSNFIVHILTYGDLPGYMVSRSAIVRHVSSREIIIWCCQRAVYATFYVHVSQAPQSHRADWD